MHSNPTISLAGIHIAYPAPSSNSSQPQPTPTSTQEKPFQGPKTLSSSRFHYSGTQQRLSGHCHQVLF
ncbi:hypothetical protein SESBI_10612 [Sesbania bispinosa]|nr:hypothetical protein SESBI_10612 [Sesbania bispinosa]